MRNLVVVENPRNWRLPMPGAEVVSARDYLTDPAFAELTQAKVYNLCRSHRYQATGYYVSLLAAARGHRPLPSIATIQDLRLGSVLKVAGQDLDGLIQKILKPLKSPEFQLSIYFGRNLARRYERLALAIYNQFPAPLLQASFRRGRSGRWRLEGVRLVGTAEIAEEHRPFLEAQAERFFARPIRLRRPKSARHDLAILWDAADPLPASNARAIRKFCAAAAECGLRPTLLTRDDFSRLPAFDALFIRLTTKVDDLTFRFARTAQAEGMVVVDDPESIIRCANKVYLAEMLQRHRLPTPRTVIFSEDTAGAVARAFGFPCVVKQPDSSFSQGVRKYETAAAFAAALPEMFQTSDLMVAQEFVPTEFDWRVGVLDGRPLYVCQYFMASRHWQILRHSEGRIHEGASRTLALEDAPPEVVALGVQAARLVGRGLYGVDIKVLEGRPVVIEVNDNPTIDAGSEDAVLGDELYLRVMRWFAARLEEARA